MLILTTDEQDVNSLLKKIKNVVDKDCAKYCMSHSRQEYDIFINCNLIPPDNDDLTVEMAVRLNEKVEYVLEDMWVTDGYEEYWVENYEAYNPVLLNEIVDSYFNEVGKT